MDFMKWLNSIGDLLYEVMSWLVFYPITLWRTIRHPLETMRYADRELHDSAGEQFTDTLNPPLFLVLSLFLTQAAGLALGGGTNPIVARKTGLAALVSDDATLLVLRLILFSLFPLMMATRSLRARHIGLTRQRLKAPFYAQCYACAPFALFLGIGMAVAHIPTPIIQWFGIVLALGSVAGYLTAETIWFAHHLQVGYARALLNAVRAFVEATVAALGIALLFVLR